VCVGFLYVEVIRPVDVFSIKTSRKWRQLLVSSSLAKTIFLLMELILVKNLLIKNLLH